MGVVGFHDGGAEDAPEEKSGGHARPCQPLCIAAFDGAENFILLRSVELSERSSVMCPRSLVESFDRELPRFALRRHVFVSIPVAAIMKELGIDPGDDRDPLLSCPIRLWDDALDDGFQSLDFVVAEKSRRRISGNTLLHNLPRLLIPIR